MGKIDQIEKANKISKITALIVYVILFYGIWSVWELWVKPFIDNNIANEYLSQLIKSVIVKNAVWILPAVLLINRFNNDMYVGLKEMFTTKVRLLRYILVFLTFTVYLLAGAYLQKGKIAISETFGFYKLIIVLFVGINEETVFRGWLLNAAVSKKKKWLPVIINSLMFLLIHFPGWIFEGVFIRQFQSLGFLSPVILGIIFGWTFIKSKSIWIPVSLHMYWDLLMFLFY